MKSSARQAMGQFNQTFWAAIATELLHCLASYTMLAYLIIYLAHDLGFGDVRANTMWGTMMFMGYFLPILLGALADKYGFRETMTVSLVIITGGYFWASRVTSYPWMFAALMAIALGGAVIKPVIAGAVKAASTDANRTLGFSIYYTVINIGSFGAPFLANFVRLKSHNGATIFVAAGVAEALAFLVVAFFFKNLPVDKSARSKSFVAVLNDMVVVLFNLRLLITGLGLGAIYLADGRGYLTRHEAWLVAVAWVGLNLVVDIPLRRRERRVGKVSQFLQPQRFGDWRFLVFILIFSGVWALYSQIFTNIPLFITRVDPAMKAHIEYFQAVDPLMIILFQVVIGKIMSKYRALPSMVVGIVISAVAVATVGPFGYAFGAWAVGLSLMIWSVGEMMFSPRMVEYVSVIAPKDKLALYIGYGFLPFAIGFGFGPPIGGHLVNYFQSLHEPDGVWFAFGVWAALLAFALWVYDKIVGESVHPSDAPGQDGPAA